MDKIKIRMVEENDFAIIKKWAKDWEVEIPTWLMPKTGFIVEGVAAGFLFATNANVGILECYVQNKKASKMLRNSSLDAITECLLMLAKDMDLKMVKCDTKYNTIINRAKKYGFTDQGKYTVLTRGI